MLKSWLIKFTKEFGELNDLPNHWYDLQINQNEMAVSTDINHLHQVLWNLCTNAIKYAIPKNNNPVVTIVAHTNTTTNTHYLDIIDKGPGISKPEQEKLFEPFYTTSSSGTGLGLYISRELCLSSGGDLSYITSPQGGSCFRIRFAKQQ